MTDAVSLDSGVREAYLAMLRGLKRRYQDYINNGGSKRGARRHFGLAIHCCETMLAAYKVLRGGNV